MPGQPDATRQTVHDSKGRVEYEVDFDGRVTSYQYVPLGNVSLVEHFWSLQDYHASTVAASTSYVLGTFTATGRLDVIADQRGISEYLYDDPDRLLRITTPEGTVHYEHDPLTDKPARVWSDDTEIQYQYDPRGLLASVTSVKEFGDTLTTPEVTTYSYNAVGLVSEQTLPGGYSASTQYDVMHRPIYHEHRDPLEDLLASYYYRRDAKGRITDVFNDLPRQTVEAAIAAQTQDQLDRTEYQYDALDRILSEMHFAAQQSQPHHQVDYVWDLVGNLHEKTVTSSGDVERSQFSYNERDELVDEVFTLNDQHQWTGQFDYDLQGNMTRSERGDTTIDYVFDVRNRLVSATNTQEAEVKLAAYQYDHDGMLVRRSETVDQNTATEFLVRDPLSPYGYSRVLEKRTEGGVLLASFVHGHEPIAEIGSDSRHLLLSDKHSGVREVVDLSADTVEHVAYDAFGNMLTAPPSISSEHLYRTEPFDPVSGQYYLRARHYSPHLAAFSQQDPFAGNIENPISLHRYQYADRDPVQNIDPTGLATLTSAMTSMAIQGAGRLSIEGARIQNGQQVTGAHAARLVQQSMTINQIVTLMDEPIIARWVAKAVPYNRMLRNRLPYNMPRRFKNSMGKFNTFVSVMAQAGTTSYSGHYRVPIKLNGFPDFTAHLYHENGIHRRNSVLFTQLFGKRGLDSARGYQVMNARFPGRFQRDVARYNWHHHEVVGILMYVSIADNLGATVAHRIGHKGGVLYWELAMSDGSRDYPECRSVKP